MTIPFFQTRLSRWSAAFIVGSFVFNVFNYLFTVVMGSLMSVASFGALNATWAVFLLLSSMPTGTIGTLSTRITSRLFGKRQKGGIARLLTSWYRWILFGSVVLAVGLIGISMLFDLPRRPAATFLAIALPLALLSSLTNAVVQGTQRFSWNVAGMVGQPFLKLVASVVLVLLGFGLGGVYVGILCSFLVAHVVTLFALRDFFQRQHDHETPEDKTWQDVLPVVSATLGLTMLGTIDMIAVKQLFSPQDVGMYAAAITVSRVVFYVSTPIVSVLFPLLAARHAAKGRYLHLFRQGAIVVVGSAVAIALFQALFPTQWMVAVFLFSPKYLAAAPLLPLLAVQMVIGAFIHLFVHFFLATRLSNTMVLFPVGATIPFVFYLLVHPNLEAIVLASIVGHAVVLLGFVVAFVRVEWKAVRRKCAALIK
ncbi:MAG: hypothetical protein Q8R11_01650 [bacterium]|nr:hypothetical protein [bacterium]